MEKEVRETETTSSSNIQENEVNTSNATFTISPQDLLMSLSEQEYEDAINNSSILNKSLKMLLGKDKNSKDKVPSSELLKSLFTKQKTEKVSELKVETIEDTAIEDSERNTLSHELKHNSQDKLTGKEPNFGSLEMGEIEFNTKDKSIKGKNLEDDERV